MMVVGELCKDDNSKAFFFFSKFNKDENNFLCFQLLLRTL